MDQDQLQPQGIWLSPALLQLERTPAEKMLLAYICQRAAATISLCTDTNKELSQAVGIHQQTISNLIKSFQGAALVEVQTEANQRQLSPKADLLTDYRQITYPLSNLLTPPKSNAYPPLSDSLTPPKPNAYPPPSKAEGNPETVVVSARPVRHCPITGVEITHQGQLYPRVTEATLKHLFKTDPAQFAAVLKRCGLEVLAGKPMGTQCGMVKMHVDRQAQTDSDTDEG